MEVRRLVRVVYHKRKKYYLITPCVTICENHFGYAMPVTTIEASASYDVLYDAIIDVMEKDCRLPNKDEDGWIENDDPPEKRFSRAYFRQDFKKKFGYYYGGGKVVETQNTLTSRRGYYYPDTECYLFLDSVVLTKAILKIHTAQAVSCL